MSTQETFHAVLEAERERIWEQAHAHFEQRALIEQTKGMVMFVYGVNADEAFDLLRTQSQQHNVKLRLIAEQIRKDLVELARTKGPARRLAFDGILFSAHRRITDVAARQRDGQSKTGVPMTELPQAPRG